MAITYGFYNSLEGDRKYNATQFSQMFDNLITDGVFASVGGCFIAIADEGNYIEIDSGRAWFNGTWILNDTILSMEAPLSEILLDRIDAVVIEINSSDEVRKNDIKFVVGTPSSNPVRPELENGETLNQYPICYIRRHAGSTEIKQADITNMIGSDDTPFVTGILQTISITELLGQWEDQLDQYVAGEQSSFSEWRENQEAAFSAWRNDQETTFSAWRGNQETAFSTWMSDEQDDFNEWFNGLNTTLEGNVATNLYSLISGLQSQIDDVNEVLEGLELAEGTDF